MDLVEKARIIAKKNCPTCNEEFAAEDKHEVCPKDATPLQLASKERDPLVGQFIAERYEIVELIGSGGWALIYKAKQKPLNRPVAIKILHGHLAGDPEKVQRFKREAEAATKLVHECIGSVFDYGLLPEGQPYMVMEYLEGITLQDVLKRKEQLSLERYVEIFRQVCSGLSLAHQRGIVHRDIKPSNIFLIDNETQAKILDFGLAKILMSDDYEATMSLTQTGQTIGTPSYMSPEQCTGFPLDARSDLYSLGCVMFEALTGRRAFEGRNLFETMSLQINAEASFDDSRDVHKIPADLQLVILKALTKDPTQRYASASELDGALGEVLKRLRGNGRGLLQAKVRTLFYKQRRAAKRMAREPLLSLVIGISLLLGVLAGWRYLSTNAIVPPSLQGYSRAAYDEHMIKAQQQVDRKKFEVAALYFGRAVLDSKPLGEDNPDYLRALRSLSSALRQAGLLDKSAGIDAELASIAQRYPGVMYGTEDGNASQIADLEKSLQADPGNKAIAEQLAQYRNRQAQLLLMKGRFEDAEFQLEKALKLECVVLNEQTPEYATSLSNLAYVKFNTGDYAGAEENYKKALELRKKFFGTNNVYVAKSLRNLGDFHYKRGDMNAAQNALEEALAIYRKAGGTKDDIAWNLNNLGMVYVAQGNFAQSEVALHEALRLRQEIDRQSPGARKSDHVPYVDVARTMFNMGVLESARKNDRAAIRFMEDALAIYEVDLGATASDTLRCAFELANEYMKIGDYKRSEPLFRRVCDSLGSKDPMAQESSARLKVIEQKTLKNG